MNSLKNMKYSIIIESTSTKQHIDEVDELEKEIQSNLNKDVTIPKDVLDSFKIKDTLNPDIWSNKKLVPKVRTTLLQLAKDFFKEIEVPLDIEIKDIIFTGSLANYNWSKFSDIDLHIVIDFKDLESDPKMVEEFFYAQKTIWNQKHNVTIFDYPTELYVQDINHKLVATAVYSVLRNEWIKEPSEQSFKLDKKSIQNKANDFIKQLKDIRNKYKKEEYIDVIDKVIHIKNKIKQMRNAGLEKGGEFSIENLVFKTLRRTEFMDILDSFKAKAYDKLLSVNETLNENIMKDLIRQRLHEAAEKPTRVIPYDDKQELKQHAYTSLSKGANQSKIDDIRFKISKAAKMSVKYRKEFDDNYFSLPTEGLGFYQLEIKHDGRLLVKQIKASGDMDQQQGPMTDVGTCKTFQNISRYCMVKAGKPRSPQFPNGAYGKSPADDAANKALLIFRQEILDFLQTGDYTSDEKGAELSAQNMTDKTARLKNKVDVQTKLGRRLTHSEWDNYVETGELPQVQKPILSLDAQKAADAEKRRADAEARIAKAKARQRNL
jgi:hypothetical protein